MSQLPKVCVILGAGASNDINGEGSTIIHRAWRPPLARDLFAIREHGIYQEIVSRYPGAEFLVQNSAPLISSGQISIENALRKYARHPNTDLQAYSTLH